MSSPQFDRSFLAPAEFEVVVMADTHHILDPQMYSEEGDSVSPTIVREWSARADKALLLARAANADLTFHLGDLTQEYAGHPSHEAGKAWAQQRLTELGPPMRYAAGNMDLGDKSDPTSPALGVTAESLTAYEAEHGRSYYRVSHRGVHFIVLNSQIMNSALPASELQMQWLEDTLAECRGDRIVLLLHMPLFLVRADEPGFGSYEVIDEPARSHLLGLISDYGVEAVFSGHIHFRTLNRYGRARLYTAPSTTLSRPGFCELFPVIPPEGGWSDLPKLGFFLVRVSADALAVHFIGTQTQAGGLEPDGSQRLLTRLSQDVSNAPLGVYLRLPITWVHRGVMAYPNLVRQALRDDYPSIACLELGARHVRFPIEDLADEAQRGSLTLLRESGVLLTATHLVTGGREGIDDDVIATCDFVELQLPGRLLPDSSDVELVKAIGRAGVGVALAPMLMGSAGTVHLRSRVGYLPEELTALESVMEEQQIKARAVCAVNATYASPWEAIHGLSAFEANCIRGIDFVLTLHPDPNIAVRDAIDGLLAAATVPSCRFFVDCLQEVDRSAAHTGGLLDRRSNPLSTFHVLRVVNTVLFHDRAPGAFTQCDLVGVDPRVRAVESASQRVCLASGHYVLKLADQIHPPEAQLIDLAAGISISDHLSSLKYAENFPDRLYLSVMPSGHIAQRAATGD